MHTIVQAVLQVRQLDQLRQGHMLMRPLLRATLQQDPQPMCTRLCRLHCSSGSWTS